MVDGEPSDIGPDTAVDSGPATARSPQAAAASGGRAGYRWTVTSLARRHRRVAAGALAVVLAAIAATLVTTVSSAHRQPLSDAASCSQWAASTHTQKLAYAHLYIDEYGRVANTADNAARVEAAIDRACTKASYLGEADDLSVLAGIRHAF